MSAAIRHCYATLWAVTVAAIAAATTFHVEFVAVGVPHDALSATPGTAVDLLTTNAGVAIWPLALAALRWHEHAGTRSVGDGLVLGQLMLHGLLVGGAIGQQPELWRFLPHLPLEWLGLAMPAAGWLAVRRGNIGARSLVVLAAATLCALSTAAALETWAVPL